VFACECVCVCGRSVCVNAGVGGCACVVCVWVRMCSVCRGEFAGSLCVGVSVYVCINELRNCGVVFESEILCLYLMYFLVNGIDQ
jgi:hypothetical protein